MVGDSISGRYLPPLWRACHTAVTQLLMYLDQRVLQALPANCPGVQPACVGKIKRPAGDLQPQSGACGVGRQNREGQVVSRDLAQVVKGLRIIHDLEIAAGGAIQILIQGCAYQLLVETAGKQIAGKGEVCQRTVFARWTGIGQPLQVARTAIGNRGSLKHRDRHAAFGQRPGSEAAGQACTQYQC